MARNEPRAPFEPDRRLSRHARKSEQARVAQQRAAREAAEAAEAAAIARQRAAHEAATRAGVHPAPQPQVPAAPAPQRTPAPPAAGGAPRRSLHAAGAQEVHSASALGGPLPGLPALPLPSLPAETGAPERVTREAAAREAAARETAAREAAAREAAAREAAARETAAREAAAREAAAREAAAREAAARETAARETAARETAARETAARETAARETAAREAAAREAVESKQRQKAERAAAKQEARAQRAQERQARKAERAARPLVERLEAEESGAPARRSRGAQLRFILASAFFVFAVCTLVSGAPVLGHGWLVRTLAAGAALVVLAGVGLSLTRSSVSSRLQLAAAAAGTVLIASFAWGAYTSVVIDGRVYLSTSPTAQAYHLTLQINEDLQQIASYDRLLQYEKADARLHYSEYEPAQAELRGLYAQYGAMEASELPSAQFVPIIEHLRAAANFGALALENKEKLITEDDAALEATVVSQRATYTDEVLTAGPQLVRVAELYGIELTASDERGPAE